MKFKLIEGKLFFRHYAIYALIAAVVQTIVSLGNYRLKFGIDWGFVNDPMTIPIVCFYWVGWMAFCYLVFWRLNPAYREIIKSKRQKKD